MSKHEEGRVPQLKEEFATGEGDFKYNILLGLADCCCELNGSCDDCPVAVECQRLLSQAADRSARHLMTSKYVLDYAQRFLFWSNHRKEFRCLVK